MGQKNYEGFIAYLQQNDVRFEEDPSAKLVRCGYDIEVGNIEIVVDFEFEERIGFFSFLNMVAPEERKGEALFLVNSFNESLNYGTIIISQSNQLVYKIMLNTLAVHLEDRHWAEMIYRLWSISRDIYPLFGSLFFGHVPAKKLFMEFLKSKEKDRAMDHPQMDLGSSKSSSDLASGSNPHASKGPVSMDAVKDESGDVPFDNEFRNWYNQN